jgi:tetratricopeptide (TPR) repeat protein
MDHAMSSLMPLITPSNPADDASYAGEEQIVAALAASGERNAARARLSGFIARHPSCAEAHNDLGVLAFEAGDMRGAASALEQAIALRPNCARYHRNRALLLLNLGDTATALAVLARALILDPTDHDTLNLVTEIEETRKASLRQNKH